MTTNRPHVPPAVVEHAQRELAVAAAREQALAEAISVIRHASLDQVVELRRAADLRLREAIRTAHDLGIDAVGFFAGVKIGG
jgi:hypothetical protein